MNIAIDIELCFSNPTGMGRFTREIIAQLASIDSANHYTLFHSNSYNSHDYLRQLKELPDNFNVIQLRWPRKLLRVLGLSTIGHGLLRTQLPDNLDVYFSPSGLLLPIHATKQIGMIHDINLFDYPSLNRWKDLIVERLTYSSMIKNADTIITVSEYSRQRILARWKLHAERVGIVSNGVNPRLGLDENDPLIRSDPRNAFGFQGTYFLWCGAMWKRKNVSTLIQAFSELRRRGHNDVSLVLAGTEGNESKAVDRLTHNLGLERNVHKIGYVSDANLYALYANASGFLFPSLYEGFGIPVLEAMICGTPVISSKQTALPEIVGNAGLLVDPLNANSISDAMESLLTNPKLSRDLSSRGRERAGEFTWRKSAEKLLGIFTQT
jgi:glycosyltransferase involved in cell wall biosynthesis